LPLPPNRDGVPESLPVVVSFQAAGMRSVRLAKEDKPQRGEVEVAIRPSVVIRFVGPAFFVSLDVLGCGAGVLAIAIRLA